MSDGLYTESSPLFREREKLDMYEKYYSPLFLLIKSGDSTATPNALFTIVPELRTPTFEMREEGGRSTLD